MAYDRLSNLDRRTFLATVGAAGAALGVALNESDRLFAAAQAPAAIGLPPLPYAQNALAPVISENTISFHYGKHHQAYVNNINKMIAGTEFEKAALEDIIKKTAGRADQVGIFNNAAQVFNHTFYWNSMKPGGGGEPQGKIANKIKESFGSYQKFVEVFSNAAATQFGSGWAWLVIDGGKLQVVKTANAETPITTSAKPLITIDVWEHAYYLDYQNRRADYIKAFVEKLINWDFAERNLT
ncbi:MAG TPA: superoxide dismutase [Acidobacteriota bacterium]|nr:superoxide dismutase [Acidobacteriota bacterium]